MFSCRILPRLAFACLLLACGGATRTAAPAAEASLSVPPIATNDGKLVELGLARISEDGSTLVAWPGIGIGATASLCAIHIERRAATCTVLSTELTEDLPNGFRVLDVSKTGRFVALQMARRVVVRDTRSLRVVTEERLPISATIWRARFSPDEERFAWTDDANVHVLAHDAQAKIVSLTSRPVSKKRSGGSGIAWSSNDTILAWSDLAQPSVVDVRTGARHDVALADDSLTFAGSHVAVNGEWAVLATNAGLVALVDPRGTEHPRYLRTSRNEQRLPVKDVFLSKQHVVVVRRNDFKSEIERIDRDDGERSTITTASIDPIALSSDGATLAWTSWSPEEDFKSFTSPTREPLSAHPMAGTFLEWSGTNMIVNDHGTCLRSRDRDAWCREQEWAPYPDITRSGSYLAIGGRHLLRVRDGDPTLTEVFVTGSLTNPVVHVLH